MTLRVKLDVLPLPQRELWPALSDVPAHFVLYGGTALALRLAHRASVDFDFFTSEPLDAEQLLRLPFAESAEVLPRQPDALTLSVAICAPVKAVTEWDYTLASIPRKDATLAPLPLPLGRRSGPPY